MIYYAKIGTQLCFTLEVPIRVCFRKRKKTFVIKSSAQQQPVLLRRAPLKLYTNDLLFMEKCTYQGRLQIQQYFQNISSVFKFPHNVWAYPILPKHTATEYYYIYLWSKTMFTLLERRCPVTGAAVIWIVLRLFNSNFLCSGK